MFNLVGIPRTVEKSGKKCEANSGNSDSASSKPRNRESDAYDCSMSPVRKANIITRQTNDLIREQIIETIEEEKRAKGNQFAFVRIFP